MSRPGGHIDENPRRRIFWKVARVNRVHHGEFFNRRAIDIALQHLIHRRARGLDAKFQLIEDEFGLALDRRVHDLAGFGIEGRKARDISGISICSRTISDAGGSSRVRCGRFGIGRPFTGFNKSWTVSVLCMGSQLIRGNSVPL